MVLFLCKPADEAVYLYKISCVKHKSTYLMVLKNDTYTVDTIFKLKTSKGIILSKIQM